MAFTDASRRMASEDDDDILAKTSKNETKIESKTLIQSRGPNTNTPHSVRKDSRYVLRAVRGAVHSSHTRHYHFVARLLDRVCATGATSVLKKQTREQNTTV